MRVEWDYTELAAAYLKRPDYATDAIDKVLNIARLKKNDPVCDVGAGAAHLTLHLLKKGYSVCAVEPNDAMRENGIKRTSSFDNVKWFEGIGEATGMPADAFKLVTFGSSFNVCNRQEALKESCRILTSKGWFACMWNHRELNDPLQQEIEAIIKNNVSDYSYGSRRENQAEVISQSGLFRKVEYIEGSTIHELPVCDFINGWKSHSTLHRQADKKFEAIITEIGDAVKSFTSNDVVSVPYTTRIWIAQKKD